MSDYDHCTDQNISRIKFYLGLAISNEAISLTDMLIITFNFICILLSCATSCSMTGNNARKQLQKKHCLLKLCFSYTSLKHHVDEGIAFLFEIVELQYLAHRT